MPTPLPRLCLIADGFTKESVRQRVIEAVDAGVPWVQLRDHEASERDFREAATELAADARAIAPRILLSVNARPDVALDIGAAFHTGRRGPSIDDARRSGVSRPVGFSVHSLEEARDVARLAPDYLIFSPVFATRSKPDAEPAGPKALADVAAAVSPLPVIALGGIDYENAAGCIRAGACGIAVVSAILAADDVPHAVRSLQGAIG